MKRNIVDLWYDITNSRFVGFLWTGCTLIEADWLPTFRKCRILVAIPDKSLFGTYCYSKKIQHIISSLKHENMWGLDIIFKNYHLEINNELQLQHNNKYRVESSFFKFYGCYNDLVWYYKLSLAHLLNELFYTFC